MPREIMNGNQSQRQDQSLDFRTRTGGDRPGDGPLNLRKRSPKYLDVLGLLEPKTGTLGGIDIADALATIEQEFAVTEPLPLGLVSVCYLDPPYEVHVLDLAGQVLEHYKVGQPMPATFEAARKLSLHPAYDYIEVYTDHLVCIRADGSVTDVER